MTFSLLENDVPATSEQGTLYFYSKTCMAMHVFAEEGVGRKEEGE